MNTTERIIDIAKDCAKTRNLSLNTTKDEKSFYLRKEIREHLKQDHSEKVLSKKCSYRVDYFIKEEDTVIELELSSNRPTPILREIVSRSLLQKKRVWI